MSDDLIKRSDAIMIMACEMYAEAQSQGYDVDSIEDFIPEAKSWMNDAPTIEPKTKVIAQVTFDEEKMREIVKEAVERFKEEYEITDRPQGEWVVKDGAFYCSCCGNDSAGLSEDDVDVFGIPLPNYCKDCGAMMKGADDE